ncbi:PorP/SprF family type IX secretion system membrane protein [Maribellus sp. YY47]|uniref:PorP/SprF family type IX secretion system membrane protein n=1 Tax=Maribellus sp. YY47 TaxID=2929486 RepID=UPI0020012FB7|nr:PorP/SprF family type IX secretion system membrane protein [Maribellus sp. YY47]MCK3686211.1 PorP/SprF family type IX secretion system membrane protein [Maribellus sp. YY47]
MKTKNRKCMIQPMLVVLMLLSVFLNKQTSAQEGAYWIGLPLKNPAAIATPSDWAYGSFSHVVYDFGDYGKESYNLVTGSFDYRVSPKAGTVGLDFYHTKIGLETANLVKVNYAFDFKVFNSAILSFGISGGTTFYKNDLSSYPLYPGDQYDPLFESFEDQHFKTFNGNIGMFFHSTKLSAGLSVTLQEQIAGEDNLAIDVPAVFTGVLAFALVNTEDFSLKPNIMVDYSDKNYLVIPGIHAEYKKTLWAGYQNGDFEDFHSVMFGVDLKQKYRIGYSYTFNDFLKTETVNSHEIVLGYRIN